MEQEKLQDLHLRILELQANISETITSLDNKVVVTINGKVEVTELKIDQSLSSKELETILPKIINLAIVKVSSKLQESMKNVARL